MILVQNLLQQLNGNKFKQELIKKIIYRLFIFFGSLIISQGSFAQKDSLKVHKINGKDYYIHIVEKGESLYFIHKKYNVPIEIIKKETPSVLDGLSIGEKIFIPIKSNLTKSSVDGNYINHTVKNKETLYSISNLYKLKQKEILAVNPEIRDGLREGIIIKIPVKSINSDIEKPK